MNKYLKLNEIKSIIIIINFMFFNNYFHKEILMHQEGGGKCKYCGSEGTISRTCPDNPDAKEKGIKVNPSKHPNAVRCPPEVRSNHLGYETGATFARLQPGRYT